MSCLVTVIIATTAEKKRNEQIIRALASVSSQQNVTFKICVVVNGSRFDQQTVELIKDWPGVEYHYVSLGNFPEALKYARTQVQTEYFAFLDDDDELLPGSLECRLKLLEQNSTYCASVGNGYRCLNGEDSLRFDALSYANSADALADIAQNGRNWLASCAGMFRTSLVSQSFFDDYATYAEWTYLAYRLANKYPIGFVSQPTYRIHLSEESLSKGEAYILAQEALIEKLLSLDFPQNIVTAIKANQISLMHSISGHYLEKNQLRKSWRYHVKSMRRLSGLSYLPYTRHLVLSWVKNIFNLM